MQTSKIRAFGKWTEGFGVILLLIFAMASVAISQTQITTGTIQGTVLDANGAAVPGAQVDITNLETNFAKSMTTDEDGRFVALAMQPGNYSVAVKKQGFATAVAERVTLTVGQALNI